MQVQSAAPGSSATSSTSMTTGPKDLGKQDFLNLLMAQLRYQDPLKPADDTQFMSQLAQFSMLEQLQDLSQRMSTLVGTEQLGQANAMIGKVVEGMDAKTGEKIKGVVTGAGVKEGTAFVTIGDKTLNVENVEQVSDTDATRILAASSMIGREVVTKDPVSSATVTGLVQSIQVDGGRLRLRVGDTYVPIENIVEAEGTSSSAVAGAAGLIGKQVGAVLHSNGQYVSGAVNSARLEDGGVLLSVDGRTVKLAEVTTVANS